MNERELQNALRALLEQIALDDDEEREMFGIPDELGRVERVRTYEEEGVLTRDAGLVTTTANGSEFQLTIVRSR